MMNVHTALDYKHVFSNNVGHTYLILCGNVMRSSDVSNLGVACGVAGTCIDPFYNGMLDLGIYTYVLFDPTFEGYDDWYKRNIAPYLMHATRFGPIR